jgi:hypothetical protein
MEIERRGSRRIDLVRLAFVKAGNDARGGLTRNVSETGVYIDFQMPLGEVSHDFRRDSEVELHFDNGVTLSGKARRIAPEGMAIHFEDRKARATLKSMIAEQEMLRQYSNTAVHYLDRNCR